VVEVAVVVVAVEPEAQKNLWVFGGGDSGSAAAAGFCLMQRWKPASRGLWCDRCVSSMVMPCKPMQIFKLRVAAPIFAGVDRRDLGIFIHG
jgi:hypothetical protein